MKRALLPVVLWLACLLAAGGWIGQSIEVSNDLAAFFPDRGRPIEKLLISKANRGAVSRMVFAAFGGGDLEHRLAASREASDDLRRHPGIEQVVNGAENLDLAAFEPLFPYRYLLAGQQLLDEAGLRAALEARVKELRSPLGSAVKEKLADDPTAAFRTLLLGWNEGRAAPPRECGLWVTEDRERSLLLATLAGTDGEGGQQARTIAWIREKLEAAAARHDVELILAGRPVLIAEAGESIKASLIFGSIAASLLVISLLLFVYRSIGVLLLGALPLLSGILAGLAAVLFLFGPVHGIALAFGVTLIGITIDYPLHLFSHSQAPAPLAETALKIQRPILLGALSTAGAFAMFGAGSAPGLGQLACFAAIGILAAALTLRLVVPPLADLARIEPRPRMVDPLPATAPGGLIWVVLAIAIASVVLLFSRHDRLFESDVSVLNPLSTAAKLRDQQLRSDLGAPDLRQLFLIDGDDAETVLQRAEALTPALDGVRLAGGIAGYDTPSRYLSSMARQAERQAGMPPDAELAAALANAQADLPFKSGLFQPFLQSIEESRALPPLDGERGLELFEKTPLGAKLDQLLLRADNRWYGFVPLIGVADMAALQSLADEVAGVELVDLKALSEDVLTEFRKEAFLLLALGSGVVLVLLAAFRYPVSGIFRIFLVLILSMVVTAAALSLLGQKLTMLHILSLLLVVGLGLDYTIFFTWPDADETQRRRTRHALLTCVLSTVLVFGLLAGSSIDLLRAIGLTVALGACTTFAVAYVMLSRHHE